MIVKTRTIVISSIKYGDSSRILKCYTRSSGIRSFIAKGVYSKRNKTNPMFSPLNQLELIFDDKSKSALKHLRDCRMAVHYVSLTVNSQKTAIALFLSEVLNSVLKEEDSNPDLFDFICSSIEFFDQKENAYSDFHLWFLLNLSRFLGFYPNIEKSAVYFDLLNGISSAELPSGVYIEGENLKLFEKLISIDFFEQQSNAFNRSERKQLLETLLKYYEIQLSDFRWPKSVEVLNMVFE